VRVDALARFLAARPMPAALVAGAASPVAPAAIRSLAFAGAPVVALDHRRDAVGFRSRFAFPALSPDPSADREAFLTFLGALSERLGRTAPVFVVADEYRDAFTEAGDRLPGRFLLSRPGRDGRASGDCLRVAYWGLLGARLPTAPANGKRSRRVLARVDPGPAIAGALGFARGRRR
jgi:hypothetical protein